MNHMPVLNQEFLINPELSHACTNRNILGPTQSFLDYQIFLEFRMLIALQ